MRQQALDRPRRWQFAAVRGARREGRGQRRTARACQLNPGRCRVQDGGARSSGGGGPARSSLRGLEVNPLAGAAAAPALRAPREARGAAGRPPAHWGVAARAAGSASSRVPLHSGAAGSRGKAVAVRTAWLGC